MTMKNICYLKTGMSVYAAQYVGECGKRRGRNMVTIKRGLATCPECKEKLRKRKSPHLKRKEVP
jgi:hypothetical protein